MNRGRIVFGYLRKRFFDLPNDSKFIRPTSNFVKESTFNVLIHRFYVDFSKTVVIDLFAGSGAFGIESISLGCENALFVDQNLLSIKCIEKNINSLDIKMFSKIINKNAELISDNMFADSANDYSNILIFMDPPYQDKNLLLSQIKRFKQIFDNKNLLIVAETDNNIVAEHFEILHKIKHRGTSILFL